MFHDYCLLDAINNVFFHNVAGVWDYRSLENTLPPLLNNLSEEAADTYTDKAQRAKMLKCGH